MKANYSLLLEDETVNKWHNSLSEVTSKLYLKRIGKFCKDNNVMPVELLSKSKKELKELLETASKKMEKRGLKKSSASAVRKAVYSWLSFNKIYLDIQKKSKYSKYLQDDNVRRWYENIGRGSKITGDTYLRRLGYFCRHNDLTPSDIVEKDKKEIQNIILDTISIWERKGKTTTNIASILKGVKSWLVFNEINLNGSIKLRVSEATPTLDDEKTPLPEELGRIFRACDMQSRVAASLMAHSGVRFATIGFYKDKDGLKIGDLLELKIKNRKVEFEKVPSLLRVRAEISKNSRSYYTFVSEEICEYITEYLEWRIQNGEELTAHSPLVARKDNGDFVSSTNISSMIKRAMLKTGISDRPYVLRHYFSTQLTLAESKRLISGSFKEYFMGHSLGIGGRYNLSKNNLPQELIEEMRETYKKSQKFLLTREMTKGEDIEVIFKRQWLMAAGMKEHEIKEEYLELGFEDLKKLVQDRFMGAEVPQNRNKQRQRVVEFDKLSDHLENGWVFHSKLDDERVIVEMN